MLNIILILIESLVYIIIKTIIGKNLNLGILYKTEVIWSYNHKVRYDLIYESNFDYKTVNSILN